jgi:hypothetical protein
MKVFALIAVVALAFTTNALASTDGTSDKKHMAGGVDIRVVNQWRSTGNPTLAGHGLGSFNYCMDGSTAPTWATFTWLEQYSFPSSETYINHRVVFAANTGPFPMQISLAFAWQECGNGVIFPPLPKTYGTNAPGDGMSLMVTAPYQGQYVVTVPIPKDMFDEDTSYDWIWLARFDGITPIPVLPPGTPGNDTGGGDYYTFSMYGSLPWNAVGGNRPWCFRVE